jgi:hypothetical protein
MRIGIDAVQTDIEPAINWISGFIGAAVDKRVAAFEQQERKNPLLTRHFSSNHDLEFALARARRYRKATGRFPKGNDFDPLYGLLIAAHRIHQQLPPAVKAPFEGRLRNAVDSVYGFRPFAYEIKIATHLMQKGWDVDFADYSGAAQFDFLARLGAIEIEVECKSTSGDTGRKIHRQEVNRLADLLLPTIKQLAETKGCHLLRITVPDRLGKTNEELKNIASTVATAADQKTDAACEHAEVSYAFEDLSSWPEPHRDPAARNFFERKFGAANKHLLFLGRQGFSVVGVMIASLKPDNVVDAIGDEAKKAAEQCSGTRPALIALHLIDPISRDEFKAMLKTSNELHAITHAVLKNASRQHVDSIAYTVPQFVWEDGFGTKGLSGDVLVLNNPEPKFQCDAIRTIFRVN